MLTRAIAVLGFLLVAACETTEARLEPQPAPLGQFRLGHNIAIADGAVLGPFARGFSETQVEAALQNAVAARLRPLDGDGLYHIGIAVGGVTLAQPGIRRVYAKGTTMIVDVTVFDNDTGGKLNPTPHRIVATGGLAGETPIIGSGVVGPPEAQLAALSTEIARAIEAWLRRNPDWFAARPGQVRVPYDLSTAAPEIDVTSTRDIAEAVSARN